jgi:hypothetical protein
MIPATAGAYIELAGAFVVGGIAVFGVLNTTLRGRRAEDDIVAQNLIKNLQTTVQVQKEALETTNARLDQTTKELHIMQGRKEVLEQLFNGNESSIISFLRMVPDLVALTKSTNEAVASLAESIKELVGSKGVTVTVTK